MDEAELVAALRAGDSTALEMLVETHGQRLLRTAVLLCGNETTAQDLVQDTFVEALRAVHRFRSRASLYTWLQAILLNLVRHYYRDNQRLVFDNELHRHEAPAPEPPASESDLQLAAAQLTAALQQLSSAHREVLVLRYYEQMKIPELARHLGVSKGTVKSRLHYATREMQKLLPAEMNLFGTGGTKDTV